MADRNRFRPNELELREQDVDAEGRPVVRERTAPPGPPAGPDVGPSEEQQRLDFERSRRRMPGAAPVPLPELNEFDRLREIQKGLEGQGSMAPQAPTDRQPSLQELQDILRQLDTPSPAAPGGSPDGGRDIPRLGPTRPGERRPTISTDSPGPIERLRRDFTLDPAEIARRHQRGVEELTELFTRAAREMVQPRQMRALLTGVGAGLGGIGGAPSGPVGVVAGTTIGSSIGGYLANIYEDIFNAGVTDQETLDRLMRPLRDALADGALTGAVVYLPFITGASRLLLSRLLNLPIDSRGLLNEASSIGVGIGIANVAQGGAARGAANVFGRVPLIGGTARRLSNRQAGQLVQAREELFGRITTPRSIQDVSTEAFEEAGRRFDAFALEANRRYQRAYEVGARAGQIIDTTRISHAARMALHRLTQRPGDIRPVIPEKIVTYLQDLASLSTRNPRISTIDFRGIDFDLENLMRVAQRETGITFIELNRIRETMANVLVRTIRRPPAEAGSRIPGTADLVAREAAQALRDANTYFNFQMRRFQTAIAQRFGRVDRNVFSVGARRQGDVTMDDFMRTVESVSSPRAARDLRRLSGMGIVRGIGRARLDDAWVKATGIEPGTFGQRFTFDAARFNRALGLNNPNSNTFATMQELLRHTDVTMDDLARFSRVAAAVANAPIADASTFMARATVLRGAGGIAPALRGALTAGLAYGTATQGLNVTAGGIAAVVLSRHGLGILMRPGALRMLTDMADPSISEAARRAAAIQFLTRYPSFVEE